VKDAINESVVAKLRHRAERGSVKYGVTMDRNDLSEVEWLQHAQDEALDCAVYLEKLIQTKLNATP
jgi:hypothetical protein